jgi:nitric oxide reductase NorD protein
MTGHRSWTGYTGSLFKDIYRQAESFPGQYQYLPNFLPCTIKPEAITAYLIKKRDEIYSSIKGFAEKVLDLPDEEFERLRHRAERRTGDSAADPGKKYLLIRGALVEPDKESLEALETGTHIPGGTLVDGRGQKGGAFPPLDLRILMEEELNDLIDEPKDRKGIKYDEWDYKRSGYRKGWCTLYEQDVHPVDDPFVSRTVSKYGGYIITLKKKFELMRNITRLLKRQKDGDDIDIDAAVKTLTDLKKGLPPSEEMYTRLHRNERDIAALFLLDMSGSTKGWINIAEKEALVLMCEALEALGDRYAIYGFSGKTRNLCEYYRIKGFEDPYFGDVRSRIAGIEPKDYTRIGPAIRHSTAILSTIEARTKLMITLSDGKPEDYDAYKGSYGIEDTRQSLMEARRIGIHVFCITIDKEAHEYLPHMYGDSGYAFIDDIRKLPAKITEVYTRLTS